MLWLSEVLLQHHELDSFEELLKESESFRKNVIEVLQEFWNSVFRSTWSQVQSQLQKSIENTRKRMQKAEILTALDSAYARLVSQWQEEGLAGRPYAGLFAGGLNNASLSAVATYDDYVPAFEKILQRCDYSIECFYADATAIGSLDTDERDARMQSLLQQAAAD